MGSADSSVNTASTTNSNEASTSVNLEAPTRVAPDRQSFEQHLWRLNHSITRLYNELKQYWTEQKRAEFSGLKQEEVRLKKNYSEFGVEEKAINESLKKLQEQHAAKQREIHDLEGELAYRDLKIAQERLHRLESHYKQKSFTNMREEQTVVNEIDKLKRNVAKLAKYTPLIEERKRLEESMKSSRQSLREVRSKMRERRDKMYEGRNRMKKLQQPYVKIRAHVSELKAERRAWIDEYEHARKNFSLWIKENRFDKAVSTFPTAMLNDNICDELEPFHETKRTCNRLIQYLNRLISACDDDTAGGVVEEPQTGADSSDSADEFPKAFEKLQLPSGSVKPPTGNPKANKKRAHVRKGVKKQNMPITHGIDFIKLFGDLDLLPPKTYGEAEGVLEEVKKILTFYEEQTSLAENGDDLCISPIPSIISISGSENFDSPIMSPRSTSSCSLALREESHDGSQQSGSRTSDHSFKNDSFR